MAKNWPEMGGGGGEESSQNCGRWSEWFMKKIHWQPSPGQKTATEKTDTSVEIATTMPAKYLLFAKNIILAWAIMATNPYCTCGTEKLNIFSY